MRRRAIAVLAILLVAVALVLLFRGGRSAPPEIVSTHAPPPPSEPAAPTPPRLEPAAVAPSASAARAPTFLPRNEREQRFLAEMAETRQTLLTKYRYPPGSQPLAQLTDMLMPHHVESAERGLSPGGDGKLRLVQSQSRIYLRPGQTAVASFRITYEGHPADINIKASDLWRQSPDAKLASITFHDDGVDPDLIAGDGEWTATIAPPSNNPPCGMKLVVDLESSGESGRIVFTFQQTGPEPARFTQDVRVALEDGSVVFHVGIKVMVPGPFEILARVYDSTGSPSVLCRFTDNLGVDATEVRLVAYGKTLLDEGAVPPLTLRDLEGWMFTFGQYPDRDVMDDWAGGFVTPPYPVSSFTSKDWNGGDMQERLDALDQSTADGLANLRSQPGP